MIAVKIGTTSWRQTETLGSDEVEFTGEFKYEADDLTPAMVWDAGLNNVRAKTAADYTAEAAALVIAMRQRAAQVIDADPAPEWKLFRAFAGVLADAFNQTNARLNNVLDAIDAATNLADLKTRVGQIQNLPANRDLGSVRNAVKDKLEAGSAD
jgi:hypothetical protein